MFIGDFLYSALFLFVLIIGAVSFTLFVRRLLVNSSRSNTYNDDINRKLDRIIELLEKQSK
ncbi:DUF4083 domain-containing protein [Rossellomorea vietnamensis]|uniref:DUF4083 domain-containing protein n=1 Tax=Rossellomorea vietnamensis TaxID=218284 RepID=A0A5D4NQJ7_9BACI|nr:DUF4083 domain-containing protein [Rossellomorea vietnamensis]TYS16615.1 DUF4083 domain-containing protein [Rossellomorea vietnamensis]